MSFSSGVASRARSGSARLLIMIFQRPVAALGRSVSRPRPIATSAGRTGSTAAAYATAGRSRFAPDLSAEHTANIHRRRSPGGMPTRLWEAGHEGHYSIILRVSSDRPATATSSRRSPSRPMAEPWRAGVGTGRSSSGTSAAGSSSCGGRCAGSGTRSRRSPTPPTATRSRAWARVGTVPRSAS